MINIAIDGPAGSGKSTIAKAVAGRLGIRYMDTGAMYRGIAYTLVKAGISASDVPEVIDSINRTDLKVEYDEEGQHIIVDGEDVNGFLRTPEVTKMSSDSAVIPEVREKLVAIQQETAKRYDIVMDGRDIGTVVMPDAPLKVFMTASPRVRALRRKLENDEKGIPCDLDQLEAEIIARDHTDSTRKTSPLKQADDAVFLDTSYMTIEEVVDFVIDKVNKVFNTDV
ncbi:MAG: (d)CMP kinase [Christensenellaceae bacterium]|nr:(d)CMP kinase [Christensenellaceae bacterium]